MKFLINAIGRFKKDPHLDLYQHYVSRLKSSLELTEWEVKKNMDSGPRQVEEGRMLLSGLPEDCFVVVLDEGGKALSTEQLVEVVSERQLEGVKHMAFLIGGADGHSAEVKARANLSLSFGRLTWPHMLVRGLLAEQLYRVQQVQANHPYHRS